MTLVHTAFAARLAALRGAPSSAWPGGTVLAPHDVLVDGTSLAACARLRATPTVHVPASADPGRVGRLWEASPRCRPEERRAGEECGYRGSPEH